LVFINIQYGNPGPLAVDLNVTCYIKMHRLRNENSFDALSNVKEALRLPWLRGALASNPPHEP
jgi:hypothetical protein